MSAALVGGVMLVAGILIGWRTARADQSVNEAIVDDTRAALIDDAADMAADGEELAVRL
ncbi:hypothetical protein [Mycolicibacterium vaccae]|uniref:hypothetical protein n=1 Tax=Mycolicibacterium vaccae TaxID=1810 RepID=UPI003CFC2BCF